jgi:hypothetical protein
MLIYKRISESNTPSKISPLNNLNEYLLIAPLYNPNNTNKPIITIGKINNKIGVFTQYKESNFL